MTRGANPSEGGPDTESVPAAASTVPYGSVKAIGGALAVHLLVSAVHAVPHVSIPIVQSDVLATVIFLAVYGLPVVGFVLLWRGFGRSGLALFTVSMAVSFALGAVLHFVVPNPDHVSSVPSGWTVPFLATATAVGIVDAAGAAVGAWLWRDSRARGDELPRTGRIDGIPDAGFRPLTRLIYWASRRMFGEVPEPLAVMAHHRGILYGTSAYETALANANRVDERLKTLANVKAAMVIGCEFCIDISSAEASKHGITEEQLRALPDFEGSDAFSEVERLVLEYAVAVSTTPTEGPDALFDALAEEFDEAELVELTAAIAYENYRARFNHATGIGAQGFTEGEFCPRPEKPPGLGN